MRGSPVRQEIHAHSFMRSADEKEHQPQVVGACFADFDGSAVLRSALQVAQSAQEMMDVRED